ncbi:MAG: hypothetical protein HC846_07130, partial [Blastocatellia bacterium]|nr:hypothetical protein [Blastocatellia bacterium]
MPNVPQNQILIKETADFFQTAEGEKKILSLLEKLSARVEIQPPITLDKLMSVFGTTALMIQPTISPDKVLEVGKLSTLEQRKAWAYSFKNIDKLIENKSLESKVKDKLYQIGSLESFAEELAIRFKFLILEIGNNETVLPNQLKIGEQFIGQLEILTKILELEDPPKIEIKSDNSSVTEEKQRASRIATESLLKKDFLPVSSSASYQAMREVVALNKFSRDVESPYPTAFVEKSSIKGKIQLTPVKNDLVYGEKLKELEASMWEKREQLSDCTVDVIDAMCATWIVQASSDESKAIITADDLLKIRGLKPVLSGSGRRGGYT